MAKLEKIDGSESLEAKIDKDLEPTTELGKEVMRQFRGAVMTRNTTRVGDYSLSELLRECYDARDDKTSCEEEDFRAKYPEWAAMPVSIVAFKVGMLVSIIRENLVDVADAPFIVDPTPEPEIPDSERERIVDELMTQIEQLGEQVVAAQEQFLEQAQSSGMSMQAAMESDAFPKLPPELVKELAAKQKVKLFREVEEHASEQAQLMQRALYDKTAEGGFRMAITQFADDFATYPYACIHGPFPTIQTDSEWDGDTYQEVKKVVWAFERVSPFDLFWTEDSANTQDGTAVFIRKKVPYDYLFDARTLAKDDPESGYKEEALENLIEMVQDDRIPRHWTEFTTSNPEEGSSMLRWSRGQSIEILIRYGRALGSELDEMGFVDMDSDRVYETKVIMCGGQVINCQINKNPSKYKRPVYTASFESRNGGIAGVGLGQKLLSIHKAYRALIQLMMYNLGLSSEPITEVDFERIAKYIPDGWIDDPSVHPGMVIPADEDRMHNGSRAIKFTQIPNITSSCLSIADYIFDMAHVISNIPAALHGQPVGSGANRTVRGLLTLQGNTLKPIHSALMNLDLEVIQPMVTLLYRLLVMYEDDFNYSGDSKIVAKGAATMVQREIQKQQAMENIQILGQLGDKINPELLDRVIKQLLSASGILEPGEEALLPTTPVMAPPQEGQVPPAPQEINDNR